MVVLRRLSSSSPPPPHFLRIIRCFSSSSSSSSSPLHSSSSSSSTTTTATEVRPDLDHAVDSNDASSELQKQLLLQEANTTRLSHVSAQQKKKKLLRDATRSIHSDHACVSSSSSASASASAPSPKVMEPRFQNFNKAAMAEESPPRHNRMQLRLSHLQKGDQCIPMKAFYLSRSVDLKALKDDALLETINYSRTTLVARCKFCAIGPPYHQDNLWQVGRTWTAGPFLVVFHYGGAVLVNFRLQDDEELYLNLVKKHCLESLDHTEESRKDDYKIVVRPSLATWSQAGYDTIFLQKLDLDNIRVVCSILAQSVSLEHHLRKADGMVNIFSKLNSGMEETGDFTMSRKELFQLVASANTTLADLVLRVRLLDRSEPAWRDSRYACIWEYLQEEFEMFDRFENMNFKLKTIQKSVEFFLEVLQNRKSDFMEWLIIILISCELSVSLYAILSESLISA